MKIDGLIWKKASGWLTAGQKPQANANAQLVLYFGSRAHMASTALVNELQSLYPQAIIAGCSTGGQILKTLKSDHEATAAVIDFAHSQVKAVEVSINSSDQSYDKGAYLAQALMDQDENNELAGVFVLSDGLGVNGAALARGLGSVLDQIPVSGGLAGDGAEFEQTKVGLGDCLDNNKIVAIGFYGKKLSFKTGHNGGWDEFGTLRTVTKSSGCTVYEIDNIPILDLYERYLDKEDYQNLPGSALLFPLRVFDPATPEVDVLRTVLAVDHKTKSMTFAGDIPAGWTAQVMQGDMDRLAEGARDAALQAQSPSDEPSLALLVSCIGRRLLMGSRITDETEAVSSVLGDNAVSVGFYSYGELCMHKDRVVCELHNQTMTITTLCEAA
jgi:hypothetical protein